MEPATDFSMTTRPRKLRYVIANNSEEFLCHFRDYGAASIISWGFQPCLALQYRSRRHALKVIQKICYHSRLFVLELREYETQILISAYDPDVPSWMPPVS